MTIKILSNANLDKRPSGYFLPGRNVPLTTVELLYVSIIDGEEVDTTLEITAEIRNDELRIYRVEGVAEAVDEFASPQGIEAADYQQEIIGQLTKELASKDSVTCEAEDLEVKFMARYAEHDGLRIVAWLSRYTEPGEDPMKALIRLLMDSGIDIDPSDVTWAVGEEPQENEADPPMKKKGKRK